jgi:hypothetical protein
MAPPPAVAMAVVVMMVMARGVPGLLVDLDRRSDRGARPVPMVPAPFHIPSGPQNQDQGQQQAGRNDHQDIPQEQSAGLAQRLGRVQGIEPLQLSQQYR